MSKTGKFNVTVHLGKQSYSPGKAVPIGGTKGLSEEEAKKLVENFGLFIASADNVAAVDEAMSGFKAELATAKGNSERLAEVTSEVTRLEGLLLGRPTVEQLDAEKQKVEQLEEDSLTLAEEVTNLTNAGKEKDARIKDLEAKVTDLEKKVPAK